VWNLTSIKNELFVVRQPHRKQIEVYSTETFKLLRTLCLEFLNDDRCCSLTSCIANNCLYIGIRFNDTVYKIDATAFPYGVDRPVSWQVGSGLIGLSVSNRRNVIVTCDRANNIEEYTTYGSLVRRVDLQRTRVKDLWHTIELCSGQYAVSQPVHGVTVVDTEGRVMFTYRNPSKSKTEKPLLKHPLYLAKGTNNCILVADKENDRIVLLNSSLTCARDLPLSLVRGLDRPHCLYLDKSRGRLYIGEYGGMRTLLFDNVLL